MRSIGSFAPFWETSTHAPANTGAVKRALSEDDSGTDTDSLRSPNVLHNHHLPPTDPYYVSGYSPNAATLPSTFPHRPVKDRGEHSRSQSLDAELASLNPPLLDHARPSSSNEDSSTLQGQHAAVMGSILHLSLLQGDYVRAGQVFGLLLRATGKTHKLSLRANGNWGIGAEILLQQGIASRRRAAADPQEDNTDFAAARDYYENLILQYPYRKQYPTIIDARTFYPALFGLMIYEATSASPANPDPASARQAELRAARDIAARLDGVLVSPPYNRFAPLLRQRGMVGLWIADLVSATAEGIDEDDARREGQIEQDKARSCFELCVRLGGEVPEEILQATK